MGGKALPGHPELGLTEGIGFSSGRLGHMWGHVNGVSRAQPGREGGEGWGVGLGWFGVGLGWVVFGEALGCFVC